jgi:hypothetical protein
MTDDNCSDCGLAHQLHARDDGIYECPSDTSNRGALCELCREPMSLRTTTITCPGRHVSALQDTSSEYTDSSMRSETPDPLLLAPDKQLPQRHYDALRRSTQPDGAVVPLRRSTRLENRRRTREDAGPYPQTQTRRSSIRMSEDSVRFSRSRRASLQDSRRIYGRSYENEAPLPTQDHPRRNSQRQVLDCVMLPPSHSTRRKSLQPHVLDRMVPVEDMEPIEGFQPFTELDPGQLPDPVTVREPIRDIAKPPFEFVWNPSVVVPAVGGMRVRVGQFERRGNSAGDTMQFAGSSAAYEGETCSQSSGSEGYFTARDWSASSSTSGHDPSDHEMPSVESFQYTASPLTFPGPPQPEFIQGSSTSVLSQQQTLANDTRDTNPSSWENEFPQFYALAQHYAAVQNQEKGVALPQLTPSCAMEQIMPSAPTFTSFQQTSCDVPFTPTPTPTPMPMAPQPPPVEESHARAKHPPRRSSMPGTIADYCPSEWTASTPERAETEAAVDDVEDWATREPWEYIHRVLTTSTCPLVMFLKMPTADIPAAAQGALGADLHLQKMLIENEHWLLIGPRDVSLYEFGVKFQTRVATQDKFVFRFGNLNWGADVNQIEDAVGRAVIESSRWGRGAPAVLPAQFMAGAMGGFVVWYALSLM